MGERRAGRYAGPSVRHPYAEELGANIAGARRKGKLLGPAARWGETSVIDCGDFDALPVEALRVLLQAASDTPFAKIELLPLDDGDFGYAAVSECSIENVTGVKLRRRLEACATLAVKVATELDRRL